MSRRNTSTLYVTGFGPAMRAKDLAYEFERSASPSPTLLVTQRVLKHRSSFPFSHPSFLTLSLPVRRFSFLRILR